MKKIWYFFLCLAGLGAVSSVAYFQHAPGYMDADYYFAGGMQLAAGAGFSEPFLWNYLDDPSGLPHPSHAYWMPLASLLAAAGMKISGMENFYGARLGFLLIAASIPPLTAALSYRLIPRQDSAIFAGLLSAIPAYYLSYQGTTDNFSIYMILGGLWFLVLGSKPFVLGILSGLMHLARADGFLWLFLSFAAVFIENRDWRLEVGRVFKRPLISNLWLYSTPQSPISILQSLFSSLQWILPVLIGYLVVMGPWMFRNLIVFGTPLSPGGGRALWLTGYDELYAFPAGVLTPAHWWVSGLGEILKVRLDAFGQNLLRAFAVQGNIFLAPLILLGFWRLRRDRRVKLGVFAWLVILFSMTIIFPHQGWRGGFFHSGAALQPLMWAAAPAGLEGVVEWGVRVRRWEAPQATAVFRAGLVGLAILMAVFVVYGRVIGADAGASWSNPAWEQSSTAYRHLEGILQSSGAKPGETVAVNNPAGYYAAAGRPAIVIPDGSVETLLAAVQRYEARYVLLEANHPAGLDELYLKPADRPGLRYLKTVLDTHIFLVE